MLGEVDWAELFLLIGVRLWPARGHLAGAGGLRRRNGGEISGPRSPQPPVPPLSSEEIELPGGSASAGGAAVIITTTRTKNTNAIITDTIRHGGRYNKNLCFAGKNCTHNLRKFTVIMHKMSSFSVRSLRNTIYFQSTKKFETKKLVYRTRAAACPEPVGLIIK